MTNLFWTPAARARVSPRRAHGTRAALPHGGRTHFDAIYKLRRAAIVEGLAHAPDDVRETQEKAIAYLDRAAEPHATHAAAGAILVQTNLPTDLGTTNDKLSRAIVDTWIEENGAAFAVLACVATTGFTARRHLPGEALVLVPLRQTTDSTLVIERRWLVLRERLATMPDEDYASARTAAAAIMENATPRIALRLAYAFPDESEWSAALARTLLDNREHGPLGVLLASLSDGTLVDQAMSLLEVKDSLPPSSVAFDLADALGARADRALIVMANAVVHGYQMGEEERQTLAALSLIPSPEVATWFAAHLDTKGVRPFATAYLPQVPQLAIEALRPLTQGRKPNEIASGILRTIERAGKSYEGEEADVADLPPVLAKPPWRGKAKAKKKPILLDLTPLPFEENVVPGAPVDMQRDPRPGLAEIRARFARGQKAYFYELSYLDYDSARGLLETTTADHWQPYHLETTIEPLVSRFGLTVLPLVLGFPKKNYGPIAAEIERIVSPRVAPLMAHVFAKIRRYRRVAERWLAAHPRAAAIRLVVDLTSADKALREAAQRALRFLALRGKREELEAVAAEYGKQASEALANALATDSLEEGAPAKPPKLPAWLDVSSLPRPILRASKKALPLDATQAVVEMLAFTDAEEPYEGIEQVRQACELGDFAWAIFEAWAAADYPSADKWAFFAVGHFGVDAHAHRLAALVRGWPTEGAFARAVLGLDVLATMRSDTALLLIHGISEKVKSRPLLERAKEKMDSVADSLGLEAEDLADRIVPTLGLDDDGSRALDFGPRQFKVGFDEYLRPFVRDANGKKLSELPKPGANDDADKATAATNEWKAIKKAAKLSASSQLARLENAMIGQRRWAPDTFHTYLVKHPLVGHLARRLAFGAYGEDGALLGTFRVAEDGTYADENDDTFTLPEGAKVGVLHPLEVSPETLAALGQRFSEYEVLQPFAQVGRETPREVTEGDAKRFAEVDTLKLLALERRGWRRGPVGDGGMVSTLEREIGPMSASLWLSPGIYAGDPNAYPSQTPHELVLRASHPIFLAEVTADLRGVGAVT